MRQKIFFEPEFVLYNGLNCAASTKRLKSGTLWFKVSESLCELRRPPAVISGSAQQISERFSKALSFPSFFELLASMCVQNPNVAFYHFGAIRLDPISCHIWFFPLLKWFINTPKKRGKEQIGAAFY